MGKTFSKLLVEKGPRVRGFKGSSEIEKSNIKHYNFEFLFLIFKLLSNPRILGPLNPIIKEEGIWTSALHMTLRKRT